MEIKVTKQELETRIKRLCAAISEKRPEWDTAIIINRINQYYFTGTMQEGILVIKNSGTVKYFVRRNYERAKEESPLHSIYPMESYKDVAQVIGKNLGNTLIESETITVAILDRLRKHFTIRHMYTIDSIIFGVRAIKSPYELYWMIEAGKQHGILLNEIAPSIMREGMSEIDFSAELFEKMLKMGYHGVSRFYEYQTEIMLGQVAFGENSLVPTNLDSPGGMRGMCPAVPIWGDRERLLKKGDLVFVDVGFGMYGYHTDRTQVYIFGAKPSDEVQKAHRKCIEVEKRAAELLRPGNIPSEIYNKVMDDLDSDFLNNFMGFGNRTVKFLGHGIGLHIDEQPVIANGFNSPIQENMVIALEPKKGIPGVGMVGLEDTYIVTPYGGQCITDGEKDIIVI